MQNQLRMAKMSRWQYGAGFIAAPKNGADDPLSIVRFYDDVKVFAPDGESPEVLDLTEGEAAEAAGVMSKFFTDGSQPTISKHVRFRRAIMFMDEDDQPIRPVGLEDLSIYLVDDNVVTTPEPAMPAVVAEVLLGDGAVEFEYRTLDADQSRRAAAAALMVANHFSRQQDAKKSPQQRSFEDHAKEVYAQASFATSEDKLPESHETEFALIQSAMVSGKAGVISKGSKDMVLRTYAALNVLMEPGRGYTRRKVEAAERDALLGMSNGTFSPDEVLTFNNVGILEKFGDDPTSGYAIAIGDLELYVENGTTVRLTKSWAPKYVFDNDKVGYQNFFDTRMGPPPLEEARAAHMEDLAPPATIGGKAVAIN